VAIRSRPPGDIVVLDAGTGFPGPPTSNAATDCLPHATGPFVPSETGCSRRRDQLTCQAPLSVVQKIKRIFFPGQSSLTLVIIRPERPALE